MATFTPQSFVELAKGLNELTQAALRIACFMNERSLQDTATNLPPMPHDAMEDIVAFLYAVDLSLNPLPE